MAPRSSRSAPAPPASRAADPSATREVEWQFSATDLEAVGRWLERHSRIDGLAIEKRSSEAIHDTYLDTADWRIWRSGFALRIRRKNGRAEATLKALRSARADLADRRELTEALPNAAIGALGKAVGPVASRVRDVAGEQELRTLFELRTSRRRFDVRRLDTLTNLAEIALDETVFPGAGAQRERPLLRVEIEAAGAEAIETLAPLAERLRADCALGHGGSSKFAAGLQAAALAPPPLERQRPPFAMDLSTPIDHAAREALAARLDDWRAHEPGARLGEDPEALHALRVAGRRMDAILTVFAPYLPVAVRKTRPRLTRLLGTLGEVRDLDIVCAQIDAFADRLPQTQRAALEPLTRYIAVERAKSRARMLRALSARATREWLQRFSSLASGKRSRSVREGSVRAVTVFPDLIRTRYRKLRKRARRLRPGAPMSEYHAVRARTKKLRYALETCAPLYGRPAQEMLETLRRFQSRLGEQQDACVVSRVLLRLATSPPANVPAESVFLMGRLAERHSREAARLGRRLEKDWRQVERRRWKALLARLAQLAGRSVPGSGRAAPRLERPSAAPEGEP
jgi:triphosphatase